MVHIGEHSAAVDTDFISHVADMHFPIEKTASIFAKVMQELGYEAIIHPLVYEKEILLEKQKYFIVKGIINLPTFEDLFSGDLEKKAYYTILFAELFKKLNGVELDLGKIDVFTYWKVKSSMGEAHTIAMCLVCGCGIFLSDDDDSKKLQLIVRNNALGSITVYNRDECISQLKERGETSLSKRERKAFTHKRI